MQDQELYSMVLEGVFCDSVTPLGILTHQGRPEELGLEEGEGGGSEAAPGASPRPPCLPPRRAALQSSSLLSSAWDVLQAGKSRF